METNNLKKYEISGDDISGCKLNVFIMDITVGKR
jgi:hypothetical protein